MKVTEEGEKGMSLVRFYNIYILFILYVIGYI